MTDLKWSGWCWKLGWVTSLAIAIPFAFSEDAILAQAEITPDNTLGAESSIVNRNGTVQNKPAILIQGGATRNANLFHSFQQFNINNEQQVYFANPAGIQRIFTRVTGGKLSEILGTLGVDGGADLFLINPKGIMFGPNARLDIRGSFIASTADSVVFANELEFSASNPSAPPLLTINMPIGLQFRNNPGNIVNQSQATTSDGSLNSVGLPVGLTVPANQTLALVGGNVTLEEGGSLSAFGGRIELGSVANTGRVSLKPIDRGWELGYKGVNSFGNIQLSQQAIVDASGFFLLPPPDEESDPRIPVGNGAGGSIQVVGANVIVVENSGITSSTLGDEGSVGGSVTVTASDSVELSGAGLFSQTEGAGKAGDLTITANRLIVRDGAAASTDTFGDGPGGNLTVTATESIYLSGTPDALTGLSTSTQDGKGKAGNLTIATGRLTVENLAQVSTSSSGDGDAGDLHIRASEIQVRGSGKLADGKLVESGLFAQVNSSTDENGEIIFPKGNGGNLTIETDRLTVEDGAQISTATSGEGKGGNLSVTARQSVEIVGVGSNGRPSRLIAETQAPGNAGNLTIRTNRLIIRDGARVTASGQRPSEFTEDQTIGDAGNLEITASDIRLDRGAIASETVSGKGGNIDIKADTIVGFRNSDISANSYGGEGGKIVITYQGLFGLEERSREEVLAKSGDFDPSLLATSDITAFSSTDPSLNGRVVFNNSNINPIQGLVELPKNPLNPDNFIALGCDVDRGDNASSFVNTGRGGLPANPGDPVSSLAVWDDVRQSEEASRDRDNASRNVPSISSTGQPIVEARGWVWEEGSNGKFVRLVANPPKVTSDNLMPQRVGCDGK